MTNYTFRPISTWPGEMTRSSDRRAAPFRAAHTQTLEQLDYELGKLAAKDTVIELALREVDIRRDGMPNLRARPEHPGVVLSFESEYGFLRYACDKFTHWEHNLRAIALGLEHLRAVERYGISTRGEQYAGWKQLDAPAEPARPAVTKDDVRERLFEIIDMYGVAFTDDHELTDARIVRRARRATHPDTRREGVPDDVWVETQRAAALLGVA